MFTYVKVVASDLTGQHTVGEFCVTAGDGDTGNVSSSLTTKSKILKL